MATGKYKEPPDLKDTDPMPWGKYKGVPMQDVPASYMFYLWVHNGLENDKFNPVARYIRSNLTQFAEEYPDGIW